MKLAGKKIFILISASAILLIVGAFVIRYIEGRDQEIERLSESSKIAGGFLPKTSCSIANEKNDPYCEQTVDYAVKSDFYPMLNRVEQGIGEVEERKIIGGIMPHHGLAAEMMAEFFYKLKKSYPQVETFIILGPNHDDLGEKVISAPFKWRIKDVGEVEIRPELYRDFLERKIAFANINVFEKEHSTQVMMPYIARYFPDAKVLPLIFTSKMTESEIDAFASELVKIVDDKTVVIGSLDFSHYLPSAETPNYDAETLNAIINRDYAKILTFNNDNVDSPVTLSVFLKTMDLLKTENVEILQNKNSADFIGREVDSSTSYFTMFFY
jgi:MEMO1 family protein